MATCVACNEPLTLDVELDDKHEDEDEGVPMTASSGAAFETRTIPDDVELTCGCHFHCSLINSSTSGEQQLLCKLSNEGGVQENLDILPLLIEEAYLKTYPEERRCRAFLEFCREGDVEAIVNLLEDEDEDGDDDGEQLQTKDIDILRYQDAMGGMSSGLHLAVQAQNLEIVWMLLMLASNLDLKQFPSEAHQAAHRLGIMRKDQAGKMDIRFLRDAEGRKAEQLAASIGGIWNDWIRSALFTV
ncbi:MAG: hypothetical protein M1830_004040 [Pleopsidium flavum]|nr:MAG: hypothetical protein M1830_004040 [Pleopsidium flavum]